MIVPPLASTSRSDRRGKQRGPFSDGGNIHLGLIRGKHQRYVFRTLLLSRRYSALKNIEPTIEPGFGREVDTSTCR